MLSGLILHKKWDGCPLERSFVSCDECETAERFCVMQMRETDGTLSMTGIRFPRKEDEIPHQLDKSKK
jgi:hypothetical protein